MALSSPSVFTPQFVFDSKDVEAEVIVPEIFTHVHSPTIEDSDNEESSSDDSIEVDLEPEDEKVAAEESEQSELEIELEETVDTKLVSTPDNSIPPIVFPFTETVTHVSLPDVNPMYTTMGDFPAQIGRAHV